MISSPSFEKRRIDLILFVEKRVKDSVRPGERAAMNYHRRKN